MKTKLQTMLTAKNARKAEIVKGIEACDSVDEIKRFSAELEGLNAEIRDLEAMIANIPDETEARTAAVTETPEIVKTQSNTERKAPAEVKTDDSKVYRSFGEQLADIKKAAMGYGVTPALEKVQRSAAGMNEGVPAEGGFMVQEDFAGNILKSAVELSPLLSLVDKYAVSANSNAVYFTVAHETDVSAHVYGGVQAYWVPEADPITPSKPVLKQERVALEKLACLAYATDEMLMDASFTGSFLMNAFALAIGRESEAKIISQVVANTGTVTVAKESGQAAATVVGKNLLKMKNALLPSSRQNSVWVMHPDVAAELPTMFLEGTNSDHFIYMPENGISVRGYDMLFGRSIIENDFCSALGAKGDVILFDPKEYMWIYKGGIQTATSIHVKFDTAEQAFRAIYRANGICKKTFTTSIKNSSVARSSYVTLAARA